MILQWLRKRHERKVEKAKARAWMDSLAKDVFIREYLRQERFSEPSAVVKAIHHLECPTTMCKFYKQEKQLPSYCAKYDTRLLVVGDFMGSPIKVYRCDQCRLEYKNMELVL